MRGWRWAPVLAVGLGAALAVGCGQQPGPISSGGTASVQHLPFDRGSVRGGMSPTQAFAAIAIPAGTSLIIQLPAPLSSANSRPGDVFEAVLDEPVVVQDQTIAPRGALLTGKVMAAQSSTLTEPGYLRLTLSSLVLNGKTLELRTSSIFANGATQVRAEAMKRQREDAPGQFAGAGASASRNEAKFSTGRRLTFRLIDSLPLHD